MFKKSKFTELGFIHSKSDPNSYHKCLLTINPELIWVPCDCNCYLSKNYYNGDDILRKEMEFEVIWWL